MHWFIHALKWKRCLATPCIKEIPLRYYLKLADMNLMQLDASISRIRHLPNGTINSQKPGLINVFARARHKITQ